MVSESKPVYHLDSATIVPAETRWPHRDECKGKFILANGYGQASRNIDFSSLIVNHDIGTGTVETKNSTYIVDHLQGVELLVGF